MYGTNVKVEPHRSSLGMDANILAMLAYLVTGALAWIPGVVYFIWIAPLVFFFIEKNSEFVRFHAMQATVLFFIRAILALIMNIIISAVTVAVYSSFYYGYGSYGAALIFVFLGAAIGITITVFAIIALIKAYGYTEYKIPLIGNLAEKFGKIAKNIKF